MNDYIVFNGVKSLCEVQFNNDYFLLGLLALMNVLIGPGQTVLYGSAFDETILVGMNEGYNFTLQPVSQ
jgi:hypothetical protein